MSAVIEILRRLHRILVQQADIRSQLERGPRMVKIAQIHYETAVADEHTHRELVKKTRMDADRKQLQLREREAKIFSVEGKMNMCKTDREYKALKDQIAADTQANAVLSDEILELLEMIDSLVAGTPDFELRCKQNKAESEKVATNTESRRISLEADLARITEDLAATEARLEGDLAGTYRRLVALRNEDALAVLEGNSCGGCNTSLSPRTIDRLLMKEPVVCTSCGCLIYPPEGR